MAASEPAIPSPGSIWIRGGHGAPARARSYVLEQLEGVIPATATSDAALIVSELVTNSVLHANVGQHQVVILELTTLDDGLRIAVTDPGSGLEPRVPPVDPGSPGGFGLRLIDNLCCAWGVARELDGTTRVWCELPLDSIPLS